MTKEQDKKDMDHLESRPLNYKIPKEKELLTDLQLEVNGFVNSKQLDLMLRPDRYIDLLDAFIEFAESYHKSKQNVTYAYFDKDKNVIVRKDITDVITLPIPKTVSDEEIEKESHQRYGEVLPGGAYHADRPYERKIFKKGAKWMRDKLTIK